jgi:drug/metabolite transporter (DMT)-like permease
MLAVATIAICARFMKSLDFAVIQVNNALFGVCFIGILLFFDTKNLTRPAYTYEADNVLTWMLTAGMINSLAQNLMVITMQNSNPASVSLYRYSGVLYGLIWDFFVFKHSFDFLQIAGLSIVFCANIGALLFKSQAEKMSLDSPELLHPNYDI